MARSLKSFNTASCQFYIVHRDSPTLNGDYTAFGRVVEGLDVVDKSVLTQTKDGNGTVFPKLAKSVQKITIETWPLEELPEIPEM